MDSLTTHTFQSDLKSIQRCSDKRFQRRRVSRVRDDFNGLVLMVHGRILKS